MLVVRFETGNAAFDEDAGGAGPEAARLLREVANKVESGQTSGTVIDGNGNTVGSFELTDD